MAAAAAASCSGSTARAASSDPERTTFAPIATPSAHSMK
jgi:hypothetical protein